MVLSINHLPAWLKHAMEAPRPTRVTFPDAGYIAVFPRERRYESNIADLGALPQLNSAEAQITHLADAVPSEIGLPLPRLQWALTMQRVQDQPAHPDMVSGLVRLVSWPSLTHLPEDTLPTVARICALLTRKPTSAKLIPLTLGLPKEHVLPLIEALHLAGNLHITGPLAGATSPAEPVAEAAATPEARPASSLIGTLWKRLTARP